MLILYNTCENPSRPCARVDYSQPDNGRHAGHLVAFFKVTLQVTSDPVLCWAQLQWLTVILQPSASGFHRPSPRPEVMVWSGGGAVKTDSCVYVCVCQGAEAVYQYIALLRCQPEFACSFFCLRKWDRNRYANQRVVMEEQWWSWGCFYHYSVLLTANMVLLADHCVLNFI